MADAALRSEAAADVGRDDSHVLGGEPVERLQRALGGRHPLGGRVVSEPGAVEVRGACPTFERRGGDASVHHGLLDHDVGALEQIGDGGQHEFGTDVGADIGEEHDVAGLRLGDGGDGGQRVVVDDHLFGRVGARILGLGEDGDDRFADEAHRVLGQRPAVEALVDVGEEVRRRDGAEVEIVGGVHRNDAGCGLGAAHVDGDDVAVGHGGAHEGHVARTCELDVVDVAAPAGEQVGIFFSDNPVAEDAHRG